VPDVDFSRVLCYANHTRRFVRQYQLEASSASGFFCVWTAPMIPTDELALMPMVATGNREASVMLRDGLLLRSHSLPAFARNDAMSKAEVFARLAAEGGDAGDKVTLAGLLLLQSSVCREARADDLAVAYARQADAAFLQVMTADDCGGRAILLSVVAALADNGDEVAALMLIELVAAIPAGSVAETRAAVRELESADG
jgi:hypothetical protein